MDFSESLQYLYGLGYETLAMKFGLDNTQTLLAAFANPQKSFVKIQIAGTNGKGSVAAFLNSICLAANINTGLFTSPHLISVTERIKINNFQISQAAFAEMTATVKSTAEKLVAEKKLEALPTFFEHLTLIGLAAFARQNTEIAILETGLGGRLDSVTAATAEIVGITPISFDHQEYLGNTLAEIAAEKAAIIRPDVCAAVIGKQLPEAMDVIRGKCLQSNIKPILTEQSTVKINRPNKSKFNATFATPDDIYENVSVNLPGRHQTDNALTAILLAESLRKFNFIISKTAIVQGLETATHSGRLDYQTTKDGFNILFDGAHNAAGAAALADYLQEFYAQTPLTIIFGAMRDKEIDEIAARLFPLAARLILTKPAHPRSAELDSMQKFVPSRVKLYLMENVAAALAKARQITAKNDLICVTGSLYLAGEAQEILFNE